MEIAGTSITATPYLIKRNSKGQEQILMKKQTNNNRLRLRNVFEMNTQNVDKHNHSHFVDNSPLTIDPEMTARSVRLSSNMTQYQKSRGMSPSIQ